jgi:hypothetical protein
MASHKSPAPRAGDTFEHELHRAFRAGGWRILRQPRRGPARPDMWVGRDARQYAVELKSAPEGRRDRLIPLLAQAILQARVAADALGPGVEPLAVVAAPRVSDSVLDEVRRFAQAYGGAAAVGVMDRQGLRAFLGAGLEVLNTSGPHGPERPPAERAPAFYLFSDLNQWMLKVLLAPRIAPDLLAAPRGEFRNASQLAHAANVSAMSASRFVRQLKAEGFADESVRLVRLVRIRELMSRWRAALLRRSQEFPMRWVIRGDAEHQLQKLLRSSAPSEPAEDSARDPRPRMCLSLFAAAEQLGFGLVHGVKPHVYVEHLDVRWLQRLGLAAVEPGQPADLNVRVPLAPQAVFRAVVWPQGLPVADILQVWLDVGNHPARGHAQAAEIEHRLLAPLLAQE